MGFDLSNIFGNSGTNVASGLGLTAGANVGMPAYGADSRYNDYSTAYNAQQQYEQQGLGALNWQGAQINNAYNGADNANSRQALSMLGQQASTNAMGADYGRDEFMRQSQQNQQAQMAAARSTAGGSLAQSAAMRGAGMQGAMGQQQAAQEWSQQQIQNQEAGAAAQGQTLGLQAMYGGQYANQDQTAAYNQAQLQQQQSALNQGVFNQAMGQGQQVQLAQLNAYLNSQGLNLNQQQFNTNVGNQMTMGMVGGLSSLANVGGMNGGNGGGGQGYGGGYGGGYMQGGGGYGTQAGIGPGY